MTTGTTLARALSSEDVPLMRKLLGLFGRAFEDDWTYQSRQPDDAYLASLLGSETFLALVAERADTVVGGLAGYVLPKFEQKRSEFYIYDLAVAQDHRRHGVATMLITELKRIASRRGIYMIFVQADHFDEAAIALYTKLGVREDVLHFDIEPGSKD